MDKYLLLNRSTGRYVGEENAEPLSLIKLEWNGQRHIFHGPGDNATQFDLAAAYSLFWHKRNLAIVPVNPLRCTWN